MRTKGIIGGRSMGYTAESTNPVADMRVRMQPQCELSPDRSIVLTPPKIIRLKRRGSGTPRGRAHCSSSARVNPDFHSTRVVRECTRKRIRALLPS
jgi:hypothetical protein